MLVLTALQLIADADDWDGHMGWGGGWWMIVWSTVTMALLFGAVFWFSRSLPVSHEPQAPPPPPPDPLDKARSVLAERYASGELSLADYRERLHNLSTANP